MAGLMRGRATRTSYKIKDRDLHTLSHERGYPTCKFGTSKVDQWKNAKVFYIL